MRPSVPEIWHGSSGEKIATLQDFREVGYKWDMCHQSTSLNMEAKKQAEMIFHPAWNFRFWLSRRFWRYIPQHYPPHPAFFHSTRKSATKCCILSKARFISSLWRAILPSLALWWTQGTIISVTGVVTTTVFDAKLIYLDTSLRFLEIPWGFQEKCLAFSNTHFWYMKPILRRITPEGAARP